MKLSLCMIVKNEEELLEQSLRQLCPYVQEIIVVDTGSTDRTKEIALNFTQQVYDFPWVDDFAAARNFSLEKASNDWVLVLDADEVITEFKTESLRTLLRVEDPIVGRIKLINIVEEKRISERISRLFKRSLFHYQGAIHEQLVRKNGAPYYTVSLEITVEHRGYTPAVIQRTQKIARNIKLLEKEVEKRPSDPYWLYQLGKTYYLAKNYDEAVACFKRALALPLNFSLEYVENLVETHVYALINCRSYAEALCLINYEKHYAGSIDYLFLMGLVYMNNAKFSQAIEQFLQCIGNQEGRVEGINSYLPKYNIAVIYECLGYRVEAISYYQKCGDYPAALKRLREI
ncbi:glycosyltransferase [Desulfosporosinus sp. OT]|uniref:glycosyltransferase n=1 Tax=Desulfosporosinus sp. OT TaxID=913865 RepID=UPI000223B2CA|nr:glycosyltransferase [Desulfosporosinus sp. OT]EGW36789.1 glycosyl transferase 2 family protein [Desulfosporosinus sp. OT]